MKTNFYIKPEIEIVSIEVEGVIAGSVGATEEQVENTILRGNKRGFWEE